MTDLTPVPVAVIGAGPVGRTAAAARLIERNLTPLIFETGAQVGASVSEWGHVQAFSPWRYDIDAAAGALLDAAGWQRPDAEAPLALAPMIDPNLHSCDFVPPHGVVELEHPEKDFYIVGMTSYGRAPTFLMATGDGQVRLVVAELAGDAKAARQVHLELPETGVCSAAPMLGEAASCCGGPAKDNADACCVKDEVAKALGAPDCGCGAFAVVKEPVAACCAVPA